MSGINPVAPFGSVFEGLTKGILARDEQDRQRRADERADAMLKLQTESNESQRQMNLFNIGQGAVDRGADPSQVFPGLKGLGLQGRMTTQMREAARPNPEMAGPMPAVPTQVEVSPFVTPGLTTAQKATIEQQRQAAEAAKAELEARLQNALQVAQIQAAASKATKQEMTDYQAEALRAKRLSEYNERLSAYLTNYPRFRDKTKIDQAISDLKAQYADVLAAPGGTPAGGNDAFLQMFKALAPEEYAKIYGAK